MSKYTTLLRYIIESMAYNVQGSIAQKIEYARPLIFDFSYPLYDASHKAELETKILKHYFTREIGAETYGLWKFYLDEKLNLIMPAYNIMYENVANNLDIFNNIDYWENAQGREDNSEHFEQNQTTDNTNDVTTTSEGKSESSQSGTGESHNTSSSTSQSNTNGSGTTKTLESDLPQVNYGGTDYGTNMSEGENSNTASTTQTDSGKQDGTTSSSSTGSTTSNDSLTQNSTGQQKLVSTNTGGRINIDERLRHIAGRQGGENIAELLIKYQSSILNIDLMIIRDLGDLFMKIY